MLHEFISEMEPDYRSPVFLSDKSLIGDSTAALNSDADLTARRILSSGQLSKVQKIRSRKLAGILGRFRAD
jgi:hypothetical protein